MLQNERFWGKHTCFFYISHGSCFCLLYFPWIVFLYKPRVINYNMGDEYILVNTIQGSFHQGNVEKFGDTAGRQCTCMTLFAIGYASFKRLGIWKKCDLDVILMNGNQLYKGLPICQKHLR